MIHDHRFLQDLIIVFFGQVEVLSVELLLKAIFEVHRDQLARLFLPGVVVEMDQPFGYRIGQEVFHRRGVNEHGLYQKVLKQGLVHKEALRLVGPFEGPLDDGETLFANPRVGELVQQKQNSQDREFDFWLENLATQNLIKSGTSLK